MFNQEFINKNKPSIRLNVLVACEESQATTIEFRKLGFNAFSCDLQRPSGGFLEWHVKGDCLRLIRQPCRFTTMDGKRHLVKKWHLLIAHPPCTYLTKAGAQLMFPHGEVCRDRQRKMLEAREFFFALWNADIDCICIENPIPMHICQLPQISTYIEPFWFGEPYSKKTCLWLKNLPPLMPTIVNGLHSPYINYGKRKGGYLHTTAVSAKKRSRTFTKVAEQFAVQYGDYITNYYRLSHNHNKK